MLFHVTWEIYPTVVLDDDKRVREALGPQLGRLMESNKVRQAGVLSGKRGGFFLFGAEMFANGKIEAHSVTPLDKIGEILQRWATEGR
jgi:hypothetical protein